MVLWRAGSQPDKNAMVEPPQARSNLLRAHCRNLRRHHHPLRLAQVASLICSIRKPAGMQHDMPAGVVITNEAEVGGIGNLISPQCRSNYIRLNRKVGESDSSWHDTCPQLVPFQLFGQENICWRLAETSWNGISRNKLERH